MTIATRILFPPQFPGLTPQVVSEGTARYNADRGAVPKWLREQSAKLRCGGSNPPGASTESSKLVSHFGVVLSLFARRLIRLTPGSNVDFGGYSPKAGLIDGGPEASSGELGPAGNHCDRGMTHQLLGNPNIYACHDHPRGERMPQKVEDASKSPNVAVDRVEAFSGAEAG